MTAELIEHRVSNPRAFMLAGNATFTLRSVSTGVRFTYKVTAADPEPGKQPCWFVGLLTPEYQYLGIIRGGRFTTTGKSRLPLSSQPVRAFAWTFTHLDCLTGTVEFWHAGSCGRCGRPLTVPESIAVGFGSDCLKQMEGL